MIHLNGSTDEYKFHRVENDFNMFLIKRASTERGASNFILQHFSLRCICSYGWEKHDIVMGRDGIAGSAQCSAKKALKCRCKNLRHQGWHSKNVALVKILLVGTICCSLPFFLSDAI